MKEWIELKKRINDRLITIKDLTNMLNWTPDELEASTQTLEWVLEQAKEIEVKK